jgi:hypothetical protein
MRKPQIKPEFVPPMLLQLVDRLPTGTWGYEVKWDSFRMQAIKCSGRSYCKTLVPRNRSSSQVTGCFGILQRSAWMGVIVFLPGLLARRFRCSDNGCGNGRAWVNAAAARTSS